MTNIDAYMELLATEGYRPTKDDEEPLIYFKAEGTRYCLQLFDGDVDYIRLSESWGLDDETSEYIAFRAVSETNLQLKFVKASIAPGERGVIFTWEALYKEPAHAEPFLVRALNQLDASSTYFFERVAALAAASEGSGEETESD